MPGGVLLSRRPALHSPNPPMRRRESHRRRKWSPTAPTWRAARPGQDFIRLFDADGDGKVSHGEWEKIKNDTVFKPYRWPQYNKNRDEWITVDEAPKAPSAKQEFR